MEKYVFSKPFGELVRSRRRTLGMTQAQLAEKSTLSLRYVQYLEAGRGEPTLSTLYALAHAFDTRVVDLFADMPERLDTLFQRRQVS